MKLIAVFVIGAIISVEWFDIRRDQLLTVVCLTWAWFFFTHLLPLLVMGVRHSQISRDSCFSLDTVNSIYHYKEKNASLTFSVNEIEKVIKVVSPPKYDNRMDFLGFGYFFYWKIILVDGTTLSISCMLLDVDDFPGKEVSKEKRLFPVPPINQWMTER